MNQKNPSLSIEKLQDGSYLEKLEKKIDWAEMEHQYPYELFDDIEMIYYFVHHQKDQNKDGNRMDNTKKEYLRELLLLAQLIAVYQTDIGIDFPLFKEGSLFRNLKARHLRKFQEWYANKYPYIIGRNSAFSPATLSRKNVIWQMFLTFLFDSGYTEEDLTSRMLTYSVQKQNRPNKDLTPAEVIEILDYFSEVDPHPIYFSLIHILVTTGIRNSEMCKLRVKDLTFDVDRDKYFLFIRGKGNKKRFIPLREKTVESIHTVREIRLLPALEEAQPNEPLLTTSTGKAYSPSYLSQLLKKAVKRANLRRYQVASSEYIENKNGHNNDKDEQLASITPHTFRHAFAILSYEQSVDIYTIQRSLGHENIHTTQIYLEKEYGKDRFATLEWNKGKIQKYV